MADFLNLAYFILASVGITCLITQSSVFSSAREFIGRKSSFLGEMVTCSMCMGFWVGVVTSQISFVYSCIYAGAISSLASYFIISLIDLMHSVSYAAETVFADED